MVVVRSITKKTVTIGGTPKPTSNDAAFDLFVDHKTSILRAIARLEKLASSLSDVGLVGAYNTVKHEANFMKESLNKTETALRKKLL